MFLEQTVHHEAETELRQRRDPERRGAEVGNLRSSFGDRWDFRQIRGDDFVLALVRRRGVYASGRDGVPRRDDCIG